MQRGNRVSKGPVIWVATALFSLGAACDVGGGPDDPNGEEGLPDLVVSEARLQSTVRTDWIYVTPGACSAEDGCVATSGWRRVVRFTTEIQNRGTAPVSLGAPGGDSAHFDHDACRDRPAIRPAPAYRLVDEGGTAVREGRARVSCWSDTVRISDVDGPANPGFPTSHQTCTQSQGISPGWAYIQSADEDCQLLDVTDLPPGRYHLEVTVDPDGRIEQEGDDRTATVAVELGAGDEHEVCLSEGDCHVPAPGSCEGVHCPALDRETSCEEGNVRVVREAPGVCHPSSQTCVETVTETDCAADEEVCRDGACVDTCASVVCEAPHPECDGTLAVTYTPGECAWETGECSDPVAHEVDCEAVEHVCESGGCVDLCEEVTCETPAPDCPSDTEARSYEESVCDFRTGTCSEPEAVTTACQVDERVCRDGECVDLCAGVSCPAPADHCDGDVAVMHGDRSCAWETGECVEVTETRVDCTADERVCDGGACVDLCEGVDCGERHSSCDGDDVLVFHPGSCDWTTGVCSEGTIERVSCEDEEVCDNGACRDADDALPDLTVSAVRLANSLSIGWEYFPEDSCALGEECIGDTGWRRLIRFTTVLENRGEGPVHLGNPVGHPDFEYDPCHFHYHYLNATDYDLLTIDGTEMVLGRKQSFCMYDVHRIPGYVGGWDEPAYPASDETCNTNQGLSPGWVDVYPSSLDCQFIDVTGVPAGTYLIRVTVNSEGLIEESDYSNNVVEVPVTLPPTSGPPSP